MNKKTTRGITKQQRSFYIMIWVALFQFVFSPLHSQEPSQNHIGKRLFMPAIQVGYIHHNSDNITGGLVIQTSLEYRSAKNLLFRINYDDFSGRLTAQNEVKQTYKAKIPLSELILGAGYRVAKNKHYFFAAVQSGIRFYGTPVVEIDDINETISIHQKAATTGTVRYTLGYEYEFFKNVFLNTEFFLGHFFLQKHFWSSERPYLGGSVGLKTTLF